jgi:CO/xanthine dehydrogenase Mo-binding subunit
MRTAYSQIAAEVLGAPLAHVRVMPFLDTDTSPFCLGTFSSRATTVGGKAVMLAAEKLRKQVMEIAGGLLKVPPHYLEARDGVIRVAAEPGRQVTMAKVGQAGLRTTASTGLEAFVNYDPPTKGTDDKYYGDYSSAYSFGAHGAEVEVDTETGFVRLIRMVAAHDVGVALNPRGVKGQILGGVAQGMGWALTENLIFKDGVVQNPSFSTYMVPTIADMPEVMPIIVESHDPVGPFGAKGVGEPALVPAPPAIANAVFDAVGVRIRDLPLSPEKVFWGMRKLEQDQEMERR